jgi:hypothetical protein
MGKHTAAAATLMVLVGLGVSGCTNGARDDSATVEPAMTGSPSAEPSTEPDEALAAPSDAQAAGDLVDQAPSASLPPTGRALATTAGVSVATSDIRTAVDDTLATVQRHGASIHTADVDIGETRDDGSVDGSGYFIVKVPPESLEALVDDLGATVGRVSGRTQDTTDVTDQLVDLDIRIGVERDVIARFRNLLDDADEFQDIVEIERVISERTIALEQLLASQRTLDDRVELATLTIELRYEPAPLGEPAADDDSSDGIADAWRAGWDVFVGALFAVGFVLAVAAPFVAVLLVVLGVIWFGTRRRRLVADRTSAVPEGPATPDDVSPAEQLAGPTRRG